MNSSTAGLSDQLRNVIRACFPIFCSLRRRSLARFDGRHRLGPRFRWRIKWAWNLRSMCGMCGRRRRSAVVWPPFLSCPGITTELARYICDPPVPAPGWAQKGRLLPHEAPFRFQRWLQTAYKSPRSKIAAPGLLFCCYVGVRFERDERTGERHQREIRWACSQIGAGVRSTSMWRPTVSLVALCVAHVGVPFEGGEYLGRGAAVHDPIEGGASVRQPGVEPSNKLQPVPSSHLLLGTLRLRGTKDCNDLTRFCRRRSEAPLQVHRVLCGYQAPNTNQQRGYRKR